MHFSFKPALGQSVHIAVPLNASTVQVHFTATLGSVDYESYVRGGLTLELWSDLAGEQGWAALPFVDQDQSLPTAQNSASSFSLVHERSSETVADNTRSLYLSFLQPVSGQTHFAYTFRLLYPSGDIYWLGNAGNNGMVVLDPILSFHAGWRIPSDDSEGRLWGTPGTPVDGVEIARLNTRLAYTFWAIGKDGRVNDLPTESSLLLVVTAGSVASPSTLLLSASPGAFVSVNSDGAINFTGPGESTLLLRTHQGSTELTAFMERVFSHAGRLTPRSPLLSCHNESGYVVLSTLENTYPGSGLIVPISPNTGQISTVPISVHTLASLFPDPQRLSIFSPAHLRSRSFDIHPGIPSEETISFTVSSTGGYFVFAPVYFLGNEDKTWEVSVLSPYSPVTSIPEPDKALPTPPDSPHLRPIAHLSRLASSTSTFSVPSLADVGIANSDRTVTSSAPVVTPARSQGSKFIAPFMRRGAALCIVFFKMLLHLLLGSFFTKRLVGASRSSFDKHKTDLSGAGTEAGSETVRAVTPDALGLCASESALSLESPSTISPRLLVDAQSTTLSILLRPLYATASADDVEIGVDGSKMSRRVKEVDNGLFLVEIDGSIDGKRVKMALR